MRIFILVSIFFCVLVFQKQHLFLFLRVGPYTKPPLCDHPSDDEEDWAIIDKQLLRDIVIGTIIDKMQVNVAEDKVLVLPLKLFRYSCLLRGWWCGSWWFFLIVLCCSKTIAIATTLSLRNIGHPRLVVMIIWVFVYEITPKLQVGWNLKTHLIVCVWRLVAVKERGRERSLKRELSISTLCPHHLERGWRKNKG